MCGWQLLCVSTSLPDRTYEWKKRFFSLLLEIVHSFLYLKEHMREYKFHISSITCFSLSICKISFYISECIIQLPLLGLSLVISIMKQGKEQCVCCLGEGTSLLMDFGLMDHRSSQPLILSQLSLFTLSLMVIPSKIFKNFEYLSVL